LDFDFPQHCGKLLKLKADFTISYWLSMILNPMLNPNVNFEPALECCALYSVKWYK